MLDAGTRGGDGVVKVGSLHRVAEMESLAIGATELEQAIDLPGVLDALGHDS
jgi:hypothetical protein